MAVDDVNTLTSPKNMRGHGPGEEEDHHQTIHSGHFMVSQVHEASDDYDDDDRSEQSQDTAFDFVTANKETSKTYTFGPRSTQMAIDASLTKLFECMTLAYSGTITSPKWKPFRGMHVTVKDKIRLNNIIWREWHMQYIYHRHPVVCDFSTPLSDDIHSKPEAVVLEGKYWKRRLDTVTAEYKKWRRYFKHRITRKPPESQEQFSEDMTIPELLERVKSTNVLPRTSQFPSATDLMITGDFMEMDFTDNFFASLNQPFAFPNPRELSQLGCSDLIQPGLIQLQPNLDEFMDIDEILGSKGPNVLSGSVIDVSSQSSNITSAINQNPMSVLTPQSSFVDNAANLNYRPITDTVDVSDFVDNQSVLLDNLYSENLFPKSGKVSSSLPLMQTISQSMGIISPDGPSRTGRRRSLPSSTVTSSTTNQKKDGFAVPKKPVPRIKQRTLAPAPVTTVSTPVSSTSSSLQSTYLAQLLTKGTYPGALISIKSEPCLPQQRICLSETTVMPSLQQQQQATLNTIQSALQQLPASSPVNHHSSNLSTKIHNDIRNNLVLTSTTQPQSTSANLLSFSSSSPVYSTLGKSPSSPQNKNISSPATFPDSPPKHDIISPSSSPGMSSPIIEEEKGGFNENRRAAHLSAEQKRRCNLKNGFDTLMVLVPALAQNPKASKADMLRKTAEFCKKLKAERSQMQKEAEILRQEIECLNNSISIVQSQLPETGVPVTRQRVDQMKEMFEDYVKNRTLHNWKFWIFSIIIGPLFDTYNNMVSTGSPDELCRTVLSWLEQHCSLVSLRPTVLNALRLLSTTTSILTEPSRVQEQATQAVTNKKHSGERNSRLMID